MSTLIDLFPEFQDRMPAEKAPLIFAALNRAISTIAKRLYLYESELIRGELDVDIYEEDTYTASTIGFTAGTEGVADTITDSAAGFVTAGFVAGMNITTDCTGNAGPFTIATAAAGTLTLTGTGDVTTTTAGSEYTITSVDDYGDLPSDFWGLLDEPNLDGEDWTLKPLPNLATKLGYTSAGEPIWYEIVGQKIYVIPPTSADETIKGPYFQKPTAITTAEATLPYNGLFDDALIEVLLNVLTQGTAGLANMDAYLNRAVDLIATKRPKRAAQSLPGGMNLDDYLV